MIMIATILADRKQSSQLIGIPAAAKINTFGIPGGVRYYINVETSQIGILPIEISQTWEPLFQYLEDCPIDWEVDSWRWRIGVNGGPSGRREAWRQAPKYDQDQARLAPICVARNMAREYAMATGATHLFFVDADVIVPPDALQKLVDLGHPLVGGWVPGRGAHSRGFYVFGPQRPVPSTLCGAKGVIEVDHGTLGCSLIERRLLSTLSFRSGASREDFKTPLSEDPAYASDAMLNNFGRWWIHTGVRCDHWDDPANPMTIEQASHDERIAI